MVWRKGLEDMGGKGFCEIVGIKGGVGKAQNRGFVNGLRAGD